MSGGEIYHGQMKDGKREGQGTQVWPNHNYYKGGFKNDKTDGYGVLVQNSGDYYFGMMVLLQETGKMERLKDPESCILLKVLCIKVSGRTISSTDEEKNILKDHLISVIFVTASRMVPVSCSGVTVPTTRASSKTAQSTAKESTAGKTTAPTRETG